MNLELRESSTWIEASPGFPPGRDHDEGESDVVVTDRKRRQSVKQYNRRPNR